VPPAPGVSSAELPLSGYLLARALARAPVDTEDVDALRRSHSTVNETRRALRHGRGNVAEDLAATDWQNLSRVAAVRRHFDDVVLPEAVRMAESQPPGESRPALVAHAGLATTAMAVGAGNCGEYAEVAMHLHAEKLLPGKEQVVMLGDPAGGGHEWAEVHNQRGRAHHVIMDPWSKGPAVLATDSRRAEPPPDARTCAGPYGHEDTPAIKRAMVERWETLTTRDARALAANIRKSVPQAHRTLLAPKLPEPQSVLHPSFIRKVAAQLQPRDEPERRPGQRALNLEILAAGVARSMGVPIGKESAKTALPPIIEAARQLVAEGLEPQADASAGSHAAGPATAARREP
jgi:hypothetical protein